MARHGSYWHNVIDQRISRRRSLAAAGGISAAAVLLAACGGGSTNSSSGAKPQASSLVTEPEDSTKQAKRGGALKLSAAADPPHFDPHLLTQAGSYAVYLSYNRLTRVQPGRLQPTDGTIIGDAAESWEFSPDKLTLTMKLRQLGTPNIAPVNGRVLDASDVLYSWDRWKSIGTNRSDLVNAISPAAPVLSLSSPDAKTIVIKLKEPISTILAKFSNIIQGQFYVLPKEGEDKFDPRKMALGAGPYPMIANGWVTSVSITHGRNANYYDKSGLFVDNIEYPIITDSAQGLSQLKAGALHTYAVNSDNILLTKKDVPDIGLYRTQLAAVGGVTVMFGVKASPPEKTPFRDVRVRQAYAMSIDRDLWIETWANVSRFKNEGIPITTAWSSAVSPAAYKGWWLDPQSKEFGENGKYFKHDIAEAKKLMAAAGLGSGVTVTANQIGSTDYGVNYAKYIEAMEGMVADTGFKFEKAIQGYATNWPAEFRDSHGFFEGIAYRATPLPTEPGDSLAAQYNKSGSFYYGFEPGGKGVTSASGPFNGDPTCEDLTQKLNTEFDDAKRKDYAADLQRYLGKMQYWIVNLGAANGLDLWWPAVRNWHLYEGDLGQIYQRLWIDDTKPPNKKA